MPMETRTGTAATRAPGVGSRTRVAFGFGSVERHVSEQYLCEAFEPEEAVPFDFSLLRPNASILQLLDAPEARGQPPAYWVHYIGAPGLPRELDRSPIPTECLEIDTFVWIESRLRWAMLFDYAFVFHPSYVPRLRKAGHPRVFLLPHAVDGRLFDGVERDRCYEIGWVGHLSDLPQYARRRRIIRPLLGQFRTNDAQRRHSKEETAEAYQRSRIVVNVSREECPEEANMRCYEAMAGGALLLTGLPTELTDLGFREGEHFVGWREEREVPELVRFYLAHEEKRCGIARTGQELVLREHTYQRRRETLPARLDEQEGQLTAPARNWPAAEVQRTYLEYYHNHQLLPALLEEFGWLRRTSGRAAWKALPTVLRALRRGLLRGLKHTDDGDPS
jgi:hypothetical protein